MAAVPLGLWGIAHPLAAAVALVAAAGLFEGGKAAVWVVRCLHDCGEFSVDLARGVRITVTRAGADESPQ